MAISFEIPDRVLYEREMLKAVAENVMRPNSRKLDENEHERPWDYINTMWPVMMDQAAKSVSKWKASMEGTAPDKPKREGPGIANIRMIILAEMLSWGDVGQYLCTPASMLAGSAVEAVGTTEQKLRFLERFGEGEPKWGAMAMTEPGAGSDTSAIRTTAVLDSATNEWILNGEKIFCTNGKLAFEESDGIIVVWATVVKNAGRAGMKPFVVESKTPGVKITKLEIKHGIRASDTAAIVFEDARIPFDNLLGSAEVRQKDGGTAGFKGAMATFDASRPMVAASAIGVGRAVLEALKDALKAEGIEIPYGKPHHELTRIQHEVLEMEMELKAAWLLTLRSAALLDHGERNNLEASMAKMKAGKVVTRMAQKAVEILGTMGYSREHLFEKWFRDSKINDLYEGTGQINTLIIARRILGYTSKELQ